MKSFFLLLFTLLSACLTSLSRPAEKRTPRIRVSLAAANKASQNNRSIPRGTRAEVFTSYQVQDGQESRRREGRAICFHVCLLSALLILANFIVTPEIRAVLAVCYDAFAARSGIEVR